MKRKFYDIYNDLYDYYLFNPRYSMYRAAMDDLREFQAFREDKDIRISIVINEAIIESQRRLSVKLRPDAKFFMLVNFHQLVALPLLVDGDMSPEDVKDLIQEDITMILNNTINAESDFAESQSDESELSGSKVLKATADIWGKLKLNNLGIWGPS